MKTLEQECGVTSTSLENARILVGERGRPDLLVFTGNTKRGDYNVDAIWEHRSALDLDWMFRGFSWNYCGEGPRGLNQFFEMLGITDLDAHDIPVDEHGVTLFTYTLKQ